MTRSTHRDILNGINEQAMTLLGEGTEMARRLEPEHFIVVNAAQTILDTVALAHAQLAASAKGWPA